MVKPMTNIITPAMSQAVPKSGWGKRVTLGELRRVTGRETVQTQLRDVSDVCGA